MKLLFVINDLWGAYMDLEHTGIMPQLRKRSVNIELTDDQIKQIGLKQIGFNLGKPVMETIESVNILLEHQQEKQQ